jgi:hypothetical protein
MMQGGGAEIHLQPPGASSAEDTQLGSSTSMTDGLVEATCNLPDLVSSGAPRGRQQANMAR